MMILVAVSVTVALNSGLFNAAQSAAKNTQAERDKEIGLSEGEVAVVGEKTYTSMQEYVDSLKSGAEGKISITINDMTFLVTTGKTWEEVLPEINQQFKENGGYNEGCDSAWDDLLYITEDDEVLNVLTVNNSDLAGGVLRCECGRCCDHR